MKSFIHSPRYAFNTDIAEPVAKHAAGLGVAVKRWKVLIQSVKSIRSGMMRYILFRYDVIYHLIGDLKVELGDKMPPVEVEDIVGR